VLLELTVMAFIVVVFVFGMVMQARMLSSPLERQQRLAAELADDIKNTSMVLKTLIENSVDRVNMTNDVLSRELNEALDRAMSIVDDEQTRRLRQYEHDEAMRRGVDGPAPPAARWEPDEPEGPDLFEVPATGRTMD
jgi:hypothetical protein